MDYGWQTMELWRGVPNTPYEISNQGRLRRFCRWKGSKYEEHYVIINGSKGVVAIQGKKYTIKRLLLDIWGIDFIEDLPNELWVDLKNYETAYQISSCGRIKSKGREIICNNGRRFFKTPQIIKPIHINSGYMIVNLHDEEGKISHHLIHRLVAEHFIPNPQQYEQVNHKDENKLNNHMDNLEWCTRSYNALYGTNQERRIASRLKNNGGKYGVSRKSKRDTTL